MPTSIVMGHVEKTPKQMNDQYIDFETRGFYEPGIFHLRINGCNDLSELNRLREVSHTSGWVSNFLHEYVHFLQDITTTHGLLHFVYYIEEIKNANKQVIDGGSDFAIPLRLSNDFNFHTNKQLMDLYVGCSESRLDVERIRYIDYVQTSENVSLKGGAVISVPKFTIRYYDEVATTNMTHRFGARHIKEYMAHAIQAQFEPTVIHDHIPYHLVELIVAGEVPRIAENPSLLIALCDASLMDYNPANLFFHSLNRMKSQGWVPADVDSVYNFVFNGLKAAGYDETAPQTFWSLFDQQVGRAESAFCDSLRADVFRSNVLWFKHLLSEARRLRHNESGFVTKLVSSPGVLSECFYQIINKIGVPFTTNAANEDCFVPPVAVADLQIAPYYPKVFQAIRQTFGGKRACSLLPFCNAKIGDRITSDDCSIAPWARVELPTLCPYAQMWKSWGLMGKTPLFQQ